MPSAQTWILFRKNMRVVVDSRKRIKRQLNRKVEKKDERKRIYDTPIIPFQLRTEVQLKP